MLIVLNRRTPRTKSVFDRTSRRYSYIETNCSHDNQEEPITISNTNQDIDQNHLDLTDSTLRQYNDVIISSNGQDDSTVSYSDDIDDDDDSDEYAYFILFYIKFFFFALPSFLLHSPCTISAVFCFASMLLVLLVLVHHLLIFIF